MSQKLVDTLIKEKYIVVFDIDGVLASYEFGDLKHSMDEDEWQKIAGNPKLSPYNNARPLPKLQEFIGKIVLDSVFVCSAAANLEEAEAKTVFVKKYYGIKKENCRFVLDKRRDKAAILSALALQNEGVKIAFVDDSISNLDIVKEKCGNKISTIHISSFFDY